MQDEFDNLRGQLSEQEWPGIYFFKFIVKNESVSVAKVAALFNDTSEMSMQPSRSGKYISISAKELMLDVESIIDVYKKAVQIDGIISL